MAQRQQESFSTIDYTEPEQSSIQSTQFSYQFNYQLYEKVMDVEWIYNVFGEFDFSGEQCGLNGSISKGDLNGYDLLSFTSNWNQEPKPWTFIPIVLFSCNLRALVHSAIMLGGLYINW